MTTTTFGPLIKEWRTRRRLSQLALAVDAGVSTRHLSFIETGRSRPSPEMVLHLSDRLGVPLQDRNTLLIAAGHAPRFSRTSLDAPEMAPTRRALQIVLDGSEPYPAIVVDRRWDVVMSNRGAGLLLAGVPDHLLVGGINVFRVSLHPEGLASAIVNFREWSAHLVDQLRRLVAASHDEAVRALLDEVLHYPNVAALDLRPDVVATARGSIALPVVMRHGERELSMFTTMTTFGSPLDITLDELAIEIFYPADEPTERFLREAGRTGVTEPQRIV